MHEPETEVVLETAAGLVRTVATCRDGRCERVTLDGVPSFVEPRRAARRARLRRRSTSMSPTEAATTCSSTPPSSGCDSNATAPASVVEVGQAVSAAARGTFAVRHPTVPEIDFISYAMLIGDDDPAAGRLRGATVLSGRVDRSPCGTGNSARLACMAARGQAVPVRGSRPPR